MTDTPTTTTPDTDTQPIRVTGEDFTLEFDTPADVERWKRQELQFWEMLTPVGSPMVPIRTVLKDWSLPHDRGSIRGRLETLFKSDYIPSTSTRGRFLAHISRSYSYDATSAAIEVIRGRRFQIRPDQSPDVQAGQVAALAFLALGVSIADIDALRATLDEAQKVRNTLDAILDERKRLENLTTQAEKDWDQRIEGYAAKVALRAPREYWDDLRQQFQRKAERARLVWYISLGLFPFVYGALALAMLYGLLTLWTDMQPKTFVGDIATHGLGNLLLLGTALGLGIWFLRQLLHRANSYEHLALDAAERVTMIETFAALRGAGLADADMGPVLAALHRPAATGFIHDDGPATPLEVLVRGLGKQGAS